MKGDELRQYMSFGGGVQSTAIAMLAINRDERLLRVTGGVVPELYLFADTGDEPRSVYDNVQYVRGLLLEVGAGFKTVNRHDAPLSKHVLDLAEQGKRGISLPPFFVESDTTPMPVRRGCTRDFKGRELDKAARLHFGCKVKGALTARQWLGMSLDEVSRMRTSKESWRETFYPLVEMGWRRGKCMSYLASEGMTMVQRSACVFCPFRSNIEWQRLRDIDRDGFVAAVQFERDVHAAWDKHGTVAGLKTRPYLHRSRIPLDQVDFTGGQMGLFDWNNECDGVCGV